MANPQFRSPHLHVLEACRHGPRLRLHKADSQFHLHTLLPRLGSIRQLARDLSSYNQRLRLTSFLRGISYLPASRRLLGNTLHLLLAAT